ncbi:MAG: universal stress protein [Anaerolineales bacterium]|nr:universal stress protein [Anaerolineales bacterium]
MHLEISDYTASIEDFRTARRRAALEAVVARLTGKSADLLAFEEVRELLKGEQTLPRGLQEIPLNAIIGSVGRYHDFTRSFLPLDDRDAERWARVRASIDQRGMPPIEVYQIGEAYFVLDGNHRVSVARARGFQTIQANVTEIQTRVPLEPTDQPDDLIRKAEYATFLATTRLDEFRPRADLTVTVPGSYRLLLHQIAEERRQLSHAQSLDIPWEVAAARWYDKIYTPLVQVIRENGLPHDFPYRTETDLYVWINRRREELVAELGWRVPVEVAAANLSTPPARDGRRARTARLTPPPAPSDGEPLTPLDSTPDPGSWRAWAFATHPREHLFRDYLVPISGTENSWLALDQALVLAKLEGDRLHGLHIVRTEAARTSKKSQLLKEEFERRCIKAGVEGELTIETGKIANLICDRACWTDFIILNISHPPGDRPLDRLTSGISTIVRHACRPVMFVPQVVPKVERLLLAFDGSPKSREALYVATYLSGKWHWTLDVLTVLETGRATDDTVQQARDYLSERGVNANFIAKTGNIADAILATAQERDSHEIIMGGYSYSRMMEVMFGSTVDRVLREANVPVFICR